MLHDLLDSDWKFELITSRLHHSSGWNNAGTQ